MSKTSAAITPPAAGEGKRGTEGHLGYLLRQAGNAHRAHVEQALADLQVTLPQFAVLTMLHAYPGHSNADLARLALLTPQTLSVIVANLEKNGMVSRHAHAVHGRIQQLSLTREGGELLARAKVRVSAVEQTLTADLSHDEEQAIRRWLVRVATLRSLKPGHRDGSA
ncbi:MarR family winged helix-turn-helix transcriptional regulator [Robbsia sp. Bb-Pol-6]|uniref:MarR family winged helix-turn-helix transcriptional regulator n=1 Tax=Robbsia betulipollinis TaxID=2981849 RepID=A0ABT3ZJU3_9BURK|nr:MarR family winged helix-turn-helix transcriptional regulator [Robbsia betulipollinis]